MIHVVGHQQNHHVFHGKRISAQVALGKIEGTAYRNSEIRQYRG